MAKIVKPELILCTHASAFAALPKTGLLPLDETEIFNMITEHNTWFGPRAYLELHTDFLQVVPYIVLRYVNSIAVYERTKKGTEARLHNLYSVGFGGHVQISDAVLNEDILDVRATLRNATNREMEEESIHSGIVSKSACGLILLDDEEVSKHHVGLFEIWTVNTPEIATMDAALKNCVFTKVSEAGENIAQFESWSKAALGYLLQHFGE